MWNVLASIFKSSRPEMSCEKGVLKGCVIFTGRHLQMAAYVFSQHRLLRFYLYMLSVW